MVRWNPASILVDGPYLLSTESTEVPSEGRAVLVDNFLYLSLEVAGAQFLAYGNHLSQLMPLALSALARVMTSDSPGRSP